MNFPRYNRSFNFMFTTILFLFCTVQSCQPSRNLKYSSVNYNFKDEGFLNANTLQTNASSKFSSAQSSKYISKRNCIQKAKSLAQKKMLRVFLHTKFNIPENSSPSLNENSFLKDYPVEFKPDEYFEAEIDFEKLIKKIYIVAIDYRTKNNCNIILRLNAKDLPKKIRSTQTRYKPSY